MSIEEKIDKFFRGLGIEEPITPLDLENLRKSFDLENPEYKAKIDNLLEDMGIKRLIWTSYLENLRKSFDLENPKYQFIYSLIGEAWLKQEADSGKDYPIHIVHQPYWLEKRMKDLRETGEFTEKK